MILSFLPLLLLHATFATHIATPPPTTNIDHWLTTATLHLPHLDLHTKVLNTDLDITLQSFHCHGLSIHTIEATPIETTLPGAALTLANLSIAECQGNYSATFGALKLATGFFSFGVKQSDIALGVLFDGSLVAAKSNRSLVFPSDLCSVSLYLDHLRFHGTLATILNGLRNTIEQVLHNVIEAHICTQLSGTVAPFANALFSPLVLPPLSSPSSPIVLPNTTHRFVSLYQDVPLLQGIVKQETDTVNASTLAARSINAVVGALTNHTGSLELPLSSTSLVPTIPVNVSGIVATSEAGITNVVLEGLNTLASLGMEVNASSPQVLNLFFNAAQGSTPFAATAGAWISTSFHLGSALYAPTPLNISGSLTIQLRDLKSALSVLFAADYTGMNALTLDGLKDIMDQDGIEAALGTVARGLYATNVTASTVQVALNQVSIKQEHNGRLAQQLTTSLSIGMSALLNVSAFRRRLLTNVYNAMEPTLRLALNEQLATARVTFAGCAVQGKDGHFVEPRRNVKIEDSHVYIKMLVVFSAALVASMLYVVGLPRVERRCCAGATNALDDLETPLIMAAAAATSNEWQHIVDGTVHKAPSISLASHYAGSWHRFGVPMLNLSCAAMGAWSLVVPVSDVRLRVTGGVVNASKIVLDDSLLLYTFPQMVSDFW